MPVATSFIHHRSGDLREVRRHFGDGVEFDASADEICLEAALLDVPLVSADPFLNELMLKSCEEAMAGRLSNVSPFRTLVENTIAPLLPHAEVGANTVARRIGLSERTFSRRLKAEGLTFAEILDDLRRDLAVRYLEERSLPVSQISWLLGFHGPSAFTHACRRWTGKSPDKIPARSVRLAPRCQPELSLPCRSTRNGPTKASPSRADLGNKTHTTRIRRKPACFCGAHKPPRPSPADERPAPTGDQDGTTLTSGPLFRGASPSSLLLWAALFRPSDAAPRAFHRTLSAEPMCQSHGK